MKNTTRMLRIARDASWEFPKAQCSIVGVEETAEGFLLTVRYGDGPLKTTNLGKSESMAYATLATEFRHQLEARAKAHKAGREWIEQGDTVIEPETGRIGIVESFNRSDDSAYVRFYDKPYFALKAGTSIKLHTPAEPLPALPKVYRLTIQMEGREFGEAFYLDEATALYIYRLAEKAETKDVNLPAL